MINVVGGRENFALVDVVNLDGFQYLSLDEVTDTALGHDGDSDGLLDAANHLGVAHTRHTSCGADIGRNAFQRHDGTGTCGLGNTGLFGSCYIHDDTAFEHLSQLAVEQSSIFHNTHCFISLPQRYIQKKEQKNICSYWGKLCS